MELKDWISIIVSGFSIAVTVYLAYSINKLKSKSERKNHIHKVQFEKEFEVYTELWAKLVEFRRFVINLRPKFSLMDGSELEKEEENTSEKFNTFYNKYEEVLDSVERNKPFYPAFLYYKIMHVFSISFAEATPQHRDINTIEYWIETETNRKKLVAKTNEICDLIRARIESIEAN